MNVIYAFFCVIYQIKQQQQFNQSNYCCLVCGSNGSIGLGYKPSYMLAQVNAYICSFSSVGYFGKVAAIQ